MFQRKSRLLAAAMCAVLAAMLIVPVSAHGHHGGWGRHSGYRQQVQTSVTVCPYEDCTEAGRHIHDGLTYCGYGHGSGVCDNNCRALCPFEDCVVAGRHYHDGAPYCGYDHAGGYCDGACQALCPLEDCQLTGRHTHGYATYCGAHHDYGYCDGSCAATATAVSYGCGHHGGC